MRCSEVQEEIAAGNSRLLRTAPGHDAAEEEVDAHVAGCPKCREEMRRQLWRRLRRWPGPLALVRTVYAARSLDLSAANAEAEERRPIARIANTVLADAIRAGATVVELAPFVRDPTNEPVTEAERHLDRSEPMSAIEADVAAYTNQEREVLRLRQLEPGGWRKVMDFPRFVSGGLRARLKSMAGVLVCREDVAQEGAFDVTLEGRGYRVVLQAMPEPSGERLTVRFVP